MSFLQRLNKSGHHKSWVIRHHRNHNSRPIHQHQLETIHHQHWFNHQNWYHILTWSMKHDCRFLHKFSDLHIQQLRMYMDSINPYILRHSIHLSKRFHSRWYKSGLHKHQQLHHCYSHSIPWRYLNDLNRCCLHYWFDRRCLYLMRQGRHQW